MIKTINLFMSNIYHICTIVTSYMHWNKVVKCIKGFMKPIKRMIKHFSRNKKLLNLNRFGSSLKIHL